MKESYRERIANHSGPEPARKGAPETGVSVGWVLSLRNRAVRDADGVKQRGRQYGGGGGRERPEVDVAAFAVACPQPADHAVGEQLVGTPTGATTGRRVWSNRPRATRMAQSWRWIAARVSASPRSARLIIDSVGVHRRIEIGFDDVGVARLSAPSPSTGRVALRKRCFSP